MADTARDRLMICRDQFEVWVPFPLERVFLFFANPKNLPRIMPPASGTRIDALRLVEPSPSPSLVETDLLRTLAGVGSEIVTSLRILPPLPFRAQWVARHGIRVEPLFRGYPGHGALQELASPARIRGGDARRN